jgi:hypothetical protein
VLLSNRLTKIFLHHQIEYKIVFDPYSGITNNLSESMNAVLKRENDWKELPVDLLALGFYYIQKQESI